MLGGVAREGVGPAITVDGPVLGSVSPAADSALWQPGQLIDGAFISENTGYCLMVANATRTSGTSISPLVALSKWCRADCVGCFGGLTPREFWRSGRLDGRGIGVGANGVGAQPGPAGGEGEAGTVGGVELGAQMFEVGSDGARRQGEVGGELSGGVSVADQGEDLEFSSGEPVDARLAGEGQFDETGGEGGGQGDTAVGDVDQGLFKLWPGGVFGQKAGGPAAEGGQQVGVEREGGGDQHPGAVSAVAAGDCTGELDPVGAGHADIGEYHVGVDLAGQGDRPGGCWWLWPPGAAGGRRG